jgi:PAS domain S-box-containing protein
MSEQSRIVFLSTRNDGRTKMAEAFARTAAPEGVVVVSGGIAPADAVHPLAVKAMGEVGIDIGQARPRQIGQTGLGAHDVVISLCPAASATCPSLPGGVQCIDWNLQDPAALEGDDEMAWRLFREARDKIKCLVGDFFDRGYFAALQRFREQEELVLNNISDGILAHDCERRIFFFNRAAEEITGYGRAQVIGQDCHVAMDGGFCEGLCYWCDENRPSDTPRTVERQVSRPDGEKRMVRQTVSPIIDDAGVARGAMVLFQDITRETRLARRAGEAENFCGIVAQDEKMLELFDLVRDLADTNMPVLVQGESGTGKELVAGAIHREGPRASNLFVPVNCGALPESLLESELFGHVKGAFTGAIRDKKGRFELADGGTIFLDEIGDISPVMQVKLLRVLQEGTFERVGGEKTIKVDVRVVSATNKNLTEEIEKGNFREDLFYRLSVVPVWLPPLRERPTDIPLLVTHILAGVLEEVGRDALEIAPETMDVLMGHSWPGNIRELQNWLRFAVVRCRGKVILPEHLPPTFRTVQTPASAGRRQRKLTAAAVREALTQSGGNKVDAAKRLNVSRATLYRFLDSADS